MAKDTKQKPEASKPESSKQPQAAEAAPQQPVKAKKSLMPLLMIGGGGLVFLVLVVAGTLFFLRGKGKSSDGMADATHAKGAVAAVDTAKTAKPEPKTTPDPKTVSHDSQPDSADLMPAQIDTAAAMAALSKSIQAADEAHAAEQSAQVSVQDSAQEAAWLTKARAALSQKEDALNARAAALDKKDKDISAKLLKLDQAISDRITNLAKLYDGMDPSAVAKLMANLDDTTVVSLIPRMKQKNASDVMSLLPPARAAAISKQIITLADDK